MDEVIPNQSRKDKFAGFLRELQPAGVCVHGVHTSLTFATRGN
jgi:hypothetical protein